MNRANHGHVVKFLGGYKQNSAQYVLFEWAEGGNLRDYWSNRRNWALNHASMHWSIKQMFGLATAIRAIHNLYPATQYNYRHGDLKPENILRFTDGQKGILKIADLGLAKMRIRPTHASDRFSVSSTDSIRYRPPEIQLGRTQEASRSYDMWSIGCVYLEWAIWLCYGRDALYGFQEQAFSHDFDGFFTIRNNDWIVSPVVKRWMDHMENTCSGAIRQLLLFIKGRLLVPFTEDSTVWSSKSKTLGLTRASADDLCQTLQEILELSDRSPEYLHNPNVALFAPPFQDTYRGREVMSRTPMNKLNSRGRDMTSLRRQPGPRTGNNKRYMTPASIDVWDQDSDNAFAKSVFGTLTMSEVPRFAPVHPIPASLCGYCSCIESGLLSQLPFSVSYQKSKVSKLDCVLCAILHDKMSSMPGEEAERAVTREDSLLRTAVGKNPIFSILAGPTQGILTM